MVNIVKIKSKFVEWLKRYLFAEIAAIIGAMAGGLLMHYLYDNLVITALGGTWGENIGYYGFILYKDIKNRKLHDEKLTLIGIIKVLRNIFIEFGAGEYVDSFVIRPAAMYYFPIYFGNVPMGLFVGKISADVAFYLLTIISYELRKKYLRE